MTRSGGVVFCSQNFYFLEFILKDHLPPSGYSSAGGELEKNPPEGSGGFFARKGIFTVLSRTPPDGNRRSSRRRHRSRPHSTTRNQTRNRGRRGTPTRKTLCFHRLFHCLQGYILSLYTNSYSFYPLLTCLVSLLWPRNRVSRCIMPYHLHRHNQNLLPMS